jgi:catechol 2,3-dioxygenase-like lactoylglutathione lyase family enzyme
VEATPVLISPHYHLGILVFDLDAACRRFTETLGIEFADARARTIRFAGPPETADVVRIRYSKSGPPYYEIIEAVGDGVFGARHGEGLHHVGVWVSDPAGLRNHLEAHTVPAQYEIAGVSGPLGESNNQVWFNDPSSLFGVRFEFIDDSTRALVESFLEASS